MKQKIFRYIKEWESKGYPYGIPDEAPVRLENLNKVPSYRKICIAILKNDVALTSLGFSKPKSKIYSLIKKQEIDERIRRNKTEVKNNI